jgi:hypothetical protein
MSKNSASMPIQMPPIEDENAPLPHEVLVGPACRLCGGVSRLTGIEPHPQHDHIDLRTYECTVCGHPFTIDVPLRSGPNGAKRDASNQNEPQR